MSEAGCGGRGSSSPGTRCVVCHSLANFLCSGCQKIYYCTVKCQVRPSHDYHNLLIHRLFQLGHSHLENIALDLFQVILRNRMPFLLPCKWRCFILMSKISKDDFTFIVIDYFIPESALVNSLHGLQNIEKISH